MLDTPVELSPRRNDTMALVVKPQPVATPASHPRNDWLSE